MFSARFWPKDRPEHPLALPRKVGMGVPKKMETGKNPSEVQRTVLFFNLVWLLHTYIHIYIFKYIHTYKYTHIQIYIDTFIHIYIYTYLHI